jgi:hypothetical protein
MALQKRPSLYDFVNPGDRVVLKGILAYSSLREKRKPKIQSKFNNDPRYTITIIDPEIVNGADTELGKNIVRKDVSHGFYDSKAGKYAGHTAWTFDSTSLFAPAIYTKETGSDHVPANDFLEKELGAGQEVEVLFSIYHNNKRDINSGQLDGVVIASPENIQYYGSGTDYTDMLGKPKGTLQKYVDERKAEQGETNVEDTTEPQNEPAEEKKDDAKVQKKAEQLFGDDD